MRHVLFLPFVLCACLVSNAADAQDTSIPTGQSDSGQISIADEPGVVRGTPIPLFDGKTLDGWGTRDGKPRGNWVVQDGAIYRAKQGGDLYHKHWYRDFVLSFEWKLNANGNSGVKYRVQPYGKQMLGCEYQMQDDKGKPFTNQSTSALYAIREPARNAQRPIGEWNQSRIVVYGNRVEHWLNGVKTVDLNIGSLDWLQRVSKSKFKDKEFFGQNREGRIFLQDHGNPVWFRNIYVIPLDADACSR